MAFLRTLFHREREPAPLCSAVIVAAGLPDGGDR